MSGYLLGWGAKSDWEEYPRDTPLSPDHSGSLVDYGGSWYYGVAPDGALRVHMAQGMQSITSSDVSVRPARAVAAPPS